MKKRGLDTDDLKAFVGSNEHVCPFGTQAERQGDVSYMRASAPDFSMLRGVADFVKSDKKALVIALPKEMTLEGAQARSDEYFLALARVLLKTQDFRMTPVEIEAVIKSQIAPNMGRDSIHHVFLSYQSRPLYFIYMGPEYRPSEQGVAHARYAPRPMLVLTWIDDVKLAHDQFPQILAEVRRRMTIAMGGLYDASERFLDQVPVVQS